MRWIAASVLVFATLLGACGEGFGASASGSSDIGCKVSYRSSVSVDIEEQETITPTEDPEEVIGFKDLGFRALYLDDGAEGRALKVSIIDTNGQAEIAAQLYQLGRDGGPKNQFSGGHGFTGLGYVYHRRLAPSCSIGVVPTERACGRVARKTSF